MGTPTSAWPRSAWNAAPRASAGTTAPVPDGGLLDAFLIAEDDTADIPGVTVVSRPLLMSDPETTAVMVAACAEVAGVR